jgi:predicted MFS family arabinose efflux permease
MISASIQLSYQWFWSSCISYFRWRRIHSVFSQTTSTVASSWGSGTVILFGADVVLANASTVWLTALGAALWGLQLGVTQGLLGAAIADAAPDRMRGAAFGIYDVAIGVGTFVASAMAGALWMAGGPSLAFGFSACVAVAAALMLMLRPLPQTTNSASWP